KEVYFIKKPIQSDHDGPWGKYINNNSSCQCNFKDTENYHCSEFLACCQHVQYWRMCGLVFTSDFQGDPSHPRSCPVLLSHSTISDLGHKPFGKGYVQCTHHNFEKEHKCNVFCRFF
ncbi:hypothetical protein EDB86DRAFT_2760579, partial [Lactarius hatsudake]